MLRQSPNLPYAHKLSKLCDDVAFKVGPLVTQELGQCSKDQEASLSQKFSNSFHSLTGGHICHNVFCKVVVKDQKVQHVWWLIQFHGGLNAGKFNM